MIAGQTVNSIMRYPEGHELAGQDMEREAECSRCQRKFSQLRLDRPYLNSLHVNNPNLLAAFLRTCQVEGKEVWTPARCPKCVRSQLNPQTEQDPNPANRTGTFLHRGRA